MPVEVRVLSRVRYVDRQRRPPTNQMTLVTFQAPDGRIGTVTMETARHSEQAERDAIRKWLEGR